MTSGAKTFELRSNLIEKRYRGVQRAPTTFIFFFEIILLEMIAIVCEKIAVFSKSEL